MNLRYHALAVFEDELILAADSVTVDYGGTTFMLIKANKLRPTADSMHLIKDHLTSVPSVLRVMHGGLQAHGQSDIAHDFFACQGRLSICGAIWRTAKPRNMAVHDRQITLRDN